MSVQKLEAVSKQNSAQDQRTLQVLELGDGFRQCTGVVFVDKYDTQNGIKLKNIRVKEPSLNCVTPTTVQFSVSAFSMALCGIVDALGHGLNHTDPNSSARNLMAMKLSMYQSLVIQPRTGMVFAAQNIHINLLRGNGRTGIDTVPIEKVLSSGQGFDMARALIITSQNEEDIKKNGIRANKSWVCFSEEDAEDFSNHIKANQNFLNNYPNVSICCDKNIGPLSNRHAIRQGLEQFENLLQSNTPIDPDFKTDAAKKAGSLLKTLCMFNRASLFNNVTSYESTANRQLNEFLNVLKTHLRENPFLVTKECSLAYETLKNMENLCHVKVSTLDAHNLQEEYEGPRPM